MNLKAYVIRSDISNQLFNVVLVNSDHSASRIALKNKEFDTACEFVLKHNGEDKEEESVCFSK